MTAALASAVACIRHIPHLLRDAVSLSLETSVRGLEDSTPEVEVAEGGCKNAIGAGLTRSGMHWTVQGANTIIALRC